MKRTIEQRIDEALAYYEPTLALLEQFLVARQHAQEFLLLACARLDSLSNLAMTKGTQKKNFVTFLQRFSGFGDMLSAVSLPDLYRSLSGQLWRLPGIIPIPGRIHMFDPQDDQAFLNFVLKSKIAITEQGVGELLKFVLRIVRENYRVCPRQPHRKSSRDKPERIFELFRLKAARYKRGIFGEAIQEILPLLQEFTLGPLLYREYRCQIIHEYGVDLHGTDTLFFKRDVPYWCTVYNEHVPPNNFLKLHFPGRFLADVLRSCLIRYKAYLKQTKKLPEAMFFRICHFETELDHLDLSTLSDGKALIPNLPR